MRKIIEEINPITGEVVTKDYYSKEKSDLIKKHYHLIYDDFFKKMSLLTGSEPKVLSWLILNANKNNFIKISYKQLAKETKISLIRLKEIMSKLQRLNFVKNIGGIIYINPFYFSKGKKQTGQLQIDLLPIFKGEDYE